MNLLDTAFKQFKKSKKKTSQEVLNSIQIASPCPVSWESMSGDDRVRFCGSCEKNVFDLSKLSADAAVELIREKEGKICIQIFKRRDGTVLTEDCPKGLQRLRRGIVKRVACIAAAFGFLGIAGVDAADAQSLASPSSDSQGTSWRGQYVSTDAVVSDSPVVVVKRETSAERASKVVRLFLAIGAIGGAIWSFKHLKRKPVWMTGLVVVAICSIFGFLWK